MKHLQDIVLESLLDSEDEIFDKGKYSGLINRIFSKNLDERRLAFSNLESLVKSYYPKHLSYTRWMKSSDSYFVQFTRPIKIEKGEAAEILDWISYIQMCKRIESSYITVCINASEERWGDKITVHELSWRHTQPNFNPQATNTELYEVPEELNDLFKMIQVEAYNHK